MCGGGFFRDSIILVSGATGTGKTLMMTEFLAGGAPAGERCLLFAFEESREQLFRNARGWGVDFAEMERDGLCGSSATYPEVAALEDHLIRIKQEIEEFGRTAWRSTACRRSSGSAVAKSFREFVIGLTSFIKHRRSPGCSRRPPRPCWAATSITETHISTITDSIILLRYVEMFGEMKRAVTVLKMRGSEHDKDIREFRIDSAGLHIGKPFRNVAGILSGNVVNLVSLDGSPPASPFSEMITVP